MVIGGKARSCDESSPITSYLANVLEKEAFETGMFEAVISRHVHAISKREMVNTSPSIWDCDMETKQIVNKSPGNSSRDISPQASFKGINYATNTVAHFPKAREKITDQNEIMANPSLPRPSRSFSKGEPDIIDELFPDISWNFNVDRKSVEASSHQAKGPMSSVKEISDNSKSELFEKSKTQASRIFNNSFHPCSARVSVVPNSNGDVVEDSKTFKVMKSKTYQRTAFCQSKELPLNHTSSTADDDEFQLKAVENVGLKTGKYSSYPKSSAATGKSFEEWSKARLNNKQVSPPKEELQPVSTTESVSPPALKPMTEDLFDLETDHFYGVRSYFDMDDCNSKEPADNESELSVNRNKMVGSHPNEPPQVARPLCRISELMCRFAKDATSPMPKEFHCIIEQMEDRGSCGAKRKSSESPVSSKSKSLSKRNRHNSSPNSHARSRYPKDSLATSEDMVNVQLTNAMENLELLLLGMEIYEIRENFPRIYDLIPAVDLEEITVPYSARAMAIVLRYVFQFPCNIPSWDAAVEVYAAAKEYRVGKLIKLCQIWFEDNPIDTADIEKITQLVKHFGVEEILQYAKTYWVSERPDFKEGPGVFESRSCTISCTMEKEALELAVPLFYSKGDLGSIKKSDFQSEIEIQSLEGVHILTGIQMKFVLDSADKGKRKDLVCEVERNGKTIMEIQEDVLIENCKVLNFTKNVVLGPKESMKVVVLIEDIKSSWCHCLKDEASEFGSKGGKLRVRFKSRNKTSDKRSLFFIDKVFYLN